MTFNKIGTQSMLALAAGAIIMTIVPILLAIVWKVWKKEKFTTMLVGAITFVLFVFVLEKPIQNYLLLPSAVGTLDTSFSSFVTARPLLFAFLIGLFPGVFEETGRFLAFKSVLKNRKNKETAISYGIGHSGIEVIIILGITFIQYLIYASMINNGNFGIVIESAQATAPDQVSALYQVAAALETFSFATLILGIVERIFAVSLHIGASILVFYACKDSKKLWLYPLAILIHTAMDFLAGLSAVGLFNPSAWLMEIMIGIIGLGTLLGAYFMLYKKDDQA